MARRLHLTACAIVLAVAGPLTAATYRTPNFVVEAPHPDMAKQFGQAAEYYRKQKALEWLGSEMPQWQQPCPLSVKPTMSGAGGATKFNYFGGNYTVVSMEIFGEVERMMNSVLPHEVTHTVFAHYFRNPVPRWADEGGSVLSEDDAERQKHDQLCRNILNAGQKVPLKRLFNVREYHEVPNVMILYAQGFSVSSYLVGLNGRATFLQFVATGMRGNWDYAAQQFYKVRSVDELEEGWLAHMRATKRQPGGATAVLAANTNPGQPRAELTRREVVRVTAPPAQPELVAATPPVYRGKGDDAVVLPPLTAPPPAPATKSPPRPVARLGKPEFSPAPPTVPPPQPTIGFEH